MPLAECHPGGTAATRRALLGPGDAEFFHLLLQRGTLHSQAIRCLAQRDHNIVHWSEFARGSHVAARESSDFLASDIREFFRRFR